MEDGGWKMEDGRWKMEDGRCKMEDARWTPEGSHSCRNEGNNKLNDPVGVAFFGNQK
jgi:hypothetical protein